MLANRRPRRFKASGADAEILRTAITMQAARPGEGAPDAQFVDNLRNELALQVAAAHERPVSLMVSRRSRLLVGAAAAVTVIGGTVAATTGVEHAWVASGPAHQVTYSHLLRMGTFQSKEGKTVGEIVAYRGNPSWVFMSIKDPGLKGTVRCQIEMANGNSGPTGTFVLQNGVGDWARPIPVDINQIRGATLVTSTGSALATASFSEA